MANKLVMTRQPSGGKDLTQEYLLTITKDPSPLLKFGRNGKPGFRLFQLTADLHHLTWQSTKKKELQKIAFKDMRECQFGQRTEKFKKANRPDLEQYSFSILYVDTDANNALDSLDLVAKDESEFQMWTIVLAGLIEKKIDRNAYASVTLAAAASNGGTPTGAGGAKKKKKLVAKSMRDVMKEANDVYAFGWGEWGQNGLGTLAAGSEAATPKLMEAMLGKHVVHMALGWSHAACLMDDGKVMQYGNKIATGLPDDMFSPQQIIALPASVSISSLSCGNFHSSALTETGRVLTWGCGAQGQLGHGDRKDQQAPRQVEALTHTPMGLENVVVQVSCGGNFTAALDSDGVVWTWGTAAHGVLGQDDPNNDQLRPMPVKDLMGTDIQRIACGEAHMFASTGSVLYAWGWNGCGQLGLGHEEDQLRPHIVESMRGNDLKDISCGSAHTVAIATLVNAKISGDIVYTWGSNCCGQLGQGKKNKLLKPTALPELRGDKSFVEVKCGAFHTVLRTQSGELYSTGLNKYGQLGHGSTKDYDEFKCIEYLTEKNCRAVACGGENTAVLVPRTWVHDKEAIECMSCKTAFTFVTRRHHCRNCGGIFCNNCSAKKMALLHLQLTEPVRVCSNCYTMLGGR